VISNGIRFSISDLTPPRTRQLRCVYRERAAISLFDSLMDDPLAKDAPGTQVFSPDTIDKVSRTVSRFRNTAVAYGVPLSQFSIFATEAMRRAANAHDMLGAIRDAAPGLTVHILAPEVEALFGCMGARSSFVGVRGLFLDLGGGSVQVTYVDTDHDAYEHNAAHTGRSMPFGAARLNRDLNHQDPKVKASTRSDLETEMRDKVDDLRGRFPDLADALADNKDAGKGGVDVYLCGGGFRGYGNILMHGDRVAPYPIPLIGTYRVSGDYFRETKKMRKVNADTKGKILGMSKRRRAQFDAIATVIEALVKAVPRIASVTFCAGGNREGALMMKLPPAVREEDPLPLLGAALPPPSPEAAGPAVAALRAVVGLVQQSLPPAGAFPLDLFPPGLLAALARRAWEGMGRDADANASAALHDAATRDLDHPGLTHRLRAALGLALWARWGGATAPADKVLRDNLRLLVGGPESPACFLAEYLGAVLAALAMVMPAYPTDPRQVEQRLER